MPRDEALATAPARRCAGMLLVPVLRVAAAVAGPAARGDAYVVAAEAELLGVWLSRAPGEHAFLPCREDPPAEASWPCWLGAHPELVREVAARLAAAPSA